MIQPQPLSTLSAGIIPRTGREGEDFCPSGSLPASDPQPYFALQFQQLGVLGSSPWAPIPGIASSPGIPGGLGSVLISCWPCLGYTGPTPTPHYLIAVRGGKFSALRERRSEIRGHTASGRALTGQRLERVSHLSANISVYGFGVTYKEKHNEASEGKALAISRLASYSKL